MIAAMKHTSLDAIRIFLAVAEMKSFTAAAIRVGVTPAAASKAVKLLEAQHGVILLTRNTRRVMLTETGSALYADLLAATCQIDDAFSSLARWCSEHWRRSSGARIPTWRSISRSMTAKSICWNVDTTRAFVSASRSRKAWWRCG